MSVLQWYMLLQTLVLLLGQLVTSIICKSFISMTDGFHTLYVFIPMAVLLHAQCGAGGRATESALAAGAPTLVGCGLSYPKMRSQSVEVFSSALCLATLCGTYCLQVLPHIMEPTEKRFPLVVTVVGALSVLHNTLVLGLTRGQLLGHWTGAQSRPRPKAIADPGEPGCVAAEAGKATAAAAAAVGSNGAEALVLSNPGACGALDTLSIVPYQVLDDPSDEYTDTLTYKCQWRDCLLTAVAAVPDLFSAVLAVINGLVLLLAIAQDCVPTSLSCTPLVHLDVAFSLLAIVVMLIQTVPQVYRYGLLLLQAPPSNVSVSELKVEISRIPGVQSLHDFHVWQLTDTCTVASVHVHCQDGFQKDRCGDLISAVTKVIQSVGISCCTIQPEFPVPLPPAVTSSSSQAEPPHPVQAWACRLACGAACEEKMCCSPTTEETALPTIEAGPLVIENILVEK
ncbi:hypothetical protein NHX12_009029 [Muraenolepis orangiensis]|uniref:Cation efflux protein cytoplasmic domain-containing protein n=1 Tax=Muraenolepis orangiensis TaxID=630683 RepID=A0A9Q0DMN3_9TELE|nr:hypothetical protein NHX12_009029 [Muraenolepis orangiensis]